MVVESLVSTPYYASTPAVPRWMKHYLPDYIRALAQHERRVVQHERFDDASTELFDECRERLAFTPAVLEPNVLLDNDSHTAQECTSTRVHNGRYGGRSTASRTRTLTYIDLKNQSSQPGLRIFERGLLAKESKRCPMNQVGAIDAHSDCRMSSRFAALFPNEECHPLLPR